MNILFVAAEVAPLTKVGGLADVVRSLPAELRRRGHDVRIMVPRYGFVDYSSCEIEPVIDSLPVLSLQEYRLASIARTAVEDIPVYLVSCDILERSASVYGGNEVEKFWTFCDCASEAIPRLGWRPSLIHCHDWHTALLPLLARKNHYDLRSVLTLHNVRYQGHFDPALMERSDLTQYWSAAAGPQPVIPMNSLAQGIMWADAVTAVSGTFAKEILTVEGGHGLQPLLQYRKAGLSGIRNGLGYEEYDPASDKLLAGTYSAADTAGKLANKRKLMELAGWKPDPSVPVFGMVSRLDEQKGLEIILEAVPELLRTEDAKFVFLGRGQHLYEEALKRLQLKHPDRVRAFVTFDNELAHLVYGGSDVFLMPSKWEPCGLGQLIAMRYGTLPLVRCAGGLADTVSNLGTDLKRGTGFVFDGFSAGELVEAMKRAVAAYRDDVAWRRVVQRIMKQNFGWDKPAREYEELYEKLLQPGQNDPST